MRKGPFLIIALMLAASRLYAQQNFSFEDAVMMAREGMIVRSTGSDAYDRYYDAQSLARSAFIMMAARLDNDVRFEQNLYSHPPYGVGRWQPTTDEIPWLQTAFSAAPPLQSISGTVKRGAAPIKHAYACAPLTAGLDRSYLNSRKTWCQDFRNPQLRTFDQQCPDTKAMRCSSAPWHPPRERRCNT